MEQVNAPGRTFLLVIGIIGVIVSVFGFLGSATALFLMDQAGPLGALVGAAVGLSMGYLLWGFLLSCYALFTYIMALAWSKNLQKAGALLAIAYIYVGLVVVDTVLTVTKVGISGLLFLPVVAIFMVLYIVGATKNKNASRNPQPTQAA